MKKGLNLAAGILFAFCLMITLLITSIEAVVYWTPGYFEKEYAKYRVTDDVHMTMEDLLDVTDEMMAFLRGKRDDLHVMTRMGGETREFFNEREIAHMEDVKGLFLAALTLRRACLLFMALVVVLAAALKLDYKKALPGAVLGGTGLFFALSAVIAGIISTDFTKYFILFHHMFFDNDLWILNPETDMLINIVPEGFFSDTVIHIGITFFACVLLAAVCCVLIIRRYKKKTSAVSH